MYDYLSKFFIIYVNIFILYSLNRNIIVNVDYGYHFVMQKYYIQYIQGNFRMEDNCLTNLE